jgi:hypothetical protein
MGCQCLSEAYLLALRRYWMVRSVCPLYSATNLLRIFQLLASREFVGYAQTSMDRKPEAGSILLAPGVGASLSFPSRDWRPSTPFPPVDEHIVKPEVSREEVIRGRKIQTMGANPEHADAHARADFVLTAHVCAGYVVSSDLLTRVSHGSNFATDVSIRQEGTDPSTGKRYLEEVSFEIVNEQSMRDAKEKAEDLVRRGVRRVFAIFVKTNEIGEWSRSRGEFEMLDPNGMFEDKVLIRPIAVRALIDMTMAECEVARALDRKGNAEIKRIRDDGHKKGLDEGRKEALEGQQKLFAVVLQARFGELPPAIRARIQGSDIEKLNEWAAKAGIAQSLDEIFRA